jgi:hypothetical protein
VLNFGLEVMTEDEPLQLLDVRGDALQIALLVATAVPAGVLASRMRTQHGEAEDLAEVLSLSESVNVPAGTFDRCLETKETAAM